MRGACPKKKKEFLRFPALGVSLWFWRRYFGKRRRVSGPRKALAHIFKNFKILKSTLEIHRKFLQSFQGSKRRLWSWETPSPATGATHPIEYSTLIINLKACFRPSDLLPRFVCIYGIDTLQPHAWGWAFDLAGGWQRKENHISFNEVTYDLSKLPLHALRSLLQGASDETGIMEAQSCTTLYKAFDLKCKNSVPKLKTRREKTDLVLGSRSSMSCDGGQRNSMSSGSFVFFRLQDSQPFLGRASLPNHGGFSSNSNTSKDPLFVEIQCPGLPPSSLFVLLNH
ncbi:hypothetical protein VNO77_44239 [Canavalia gladiata]|uniref:Uncharacterized protein n=1 Tax=Canavalia gladiata TaxID=3824 RepID=A0AAN9JXQ5_CANGL